VQVDGPEVAYFTVAEAREAIVRLTPGEKTKLMMAAKLYAKRNRSKYDFEELFNEAATRILEGKRPWPKREPFPNFFCGVLKSIADGWRTVRRDYTEQEFDNSEVETHQAKEMLTAEPEQDLPSLQEFLKIFEDDKVAQDLLLRKLEGRMGVEVWRTLGITKTQYESKLTKIKRRASLWLLSAKREM
jgi:hypothetical protein